jgi:hypothetical protein
VSSHILLCGRYFDAARQEAVMLIVRLFPGTSAPDTDNRITVKRRDDGKFEFFGALGEPKISMTLDPRIFETCDEAREAAAKWAEDEGAAKVFLVLPD